MMKTMSCSQRSPSAKVKKVNMSLKSVLVEDICKQKCDLQKTYHIYYLFVNKSDLCLLKLVLRFQLILGIYISTL